MVGEILEFIAKVIFQTILQIIVWILLTPIFFFFATPVILLIALFREGDYRGNIKKYYTKAFNFWKECIVIVPDFFELDF